MKESKNEWCNNFDGRKSREALTSDSTIFAWKVGNAITHPLSKMSVAASPFHPPSSFTTMLYVLREILMKGTKKPRMFVFIYVCGVCVCQYMCVLYIWVCVWQVLYGTVAGLFPVAAFWACRVGGTISEVLLLTWIWVRSSIRLSSVYSIPCTLWIFVGCCRRMW